MPGAIIRPFGHSGYLGIQQSGNLAPRPLAPPGRSAIWAIWAIWAFGF